MGKKQKRCALFFGAVKVIHSDIYYAAEFCEIFEIYFFEIDRVVREIFYF